jgi:phytoene dehydrogenase-like protein
MQHDPDAVVVGAGHNGLVCAAYLARAGLRVLLLEARTSVGGCASTVEAVGGRVNICSCDHTAVRTLPLIEELELARHGLRYLDLDLLTVAQSWSGDRPLLVFHDEQRTLESLALTQPDQIDGFRRFIRAAVPVARLIMELAQRPPEPVPVLRRLAGRRVGAVPTLLRWSRMSAAQVLRQYFTSETIIGLCVAGGTAVWGVSPHQAGTGLGALRLAIGQVTRPGRPVGGSGRLTDALRASFEAAGGVVRTGTTVDRLLLDGSRVVGVRAADGTEVRTATVVVASDPRTAILEWLHDPPASVRSFQDGWHQRDQRDGYESKLDATVAALPRYRGLDDRLLRSLGVTPDETLAASTFFSPTVDGIAAAHRLNTEGRVASRPILLANFPSVLDPTMRSPAGHHVFSLEVLFTPYRLAGGWPGSSEPRRWLELYAAQTDGGFLEGVQQWRAMTPDRYEAEFHLPRGHAPSFSGGPLTALLGRERELTRYRTPIEGLFLTGAATFPGAGVWGAAGRNAAQVVLRALPAGAAA